MTLCPGVLCGLRCPPLFCAAPSLPSCCPCCRAVCCVLSCRAVVCCVCGAVSCYALVIMSCRRVRCCSLVLVVPPPVARCCGPCCLLSLCVVWRCVALFGAAPCCCALCCAALCPAARPVVMRCGVTHLCPRLAARPALLLFGMMRLLAPPSRGLSCGVAPWSPVLLVVYAVCCPRVSCCAVCVLGLPLPSLPACTKPHCHIWYSLNPVAPCVRACVG